MRLVRWSIVACLLAAPFVANADIPPGPGPSRGCRCGAADLSLVAMVGLLGRRKSARGLG